MPNNKASKLLGLNEQQRKLYNRTGEEAPKQYSMANKARKLFGFTPRTTGGKHRKSHRKGHHNKRRVTRKNRRN